MFSVLQSEMRNWSSVDNPKLRWECILLDFTVLFTIEIWLKLDFEQLLKITSASWLKKWDFPLKVTLAMFLSRNMLLLYKCELNHHADLITVYDGLGCLYLFKSLYQKYCTERQKKKSRTGISGVIFESRVALPPHTLACQ